MHHIQSLTPGFNVTSGTLECVSRSPDATRRLGRDIARDLKPGDAVLLTGNLGAGKSVLARGIAEGLGVSDWRGSPTFTLVNEYDTHPPLYHMDLYRLGEEDVVELGIEEYLRPDAIVVVEWADRAEAYLRSLAARPIGINLSIAGVEERLLHISRPPDRA